MSLMRRLACAGLSACLAASLVGCGSKDDTVNLTFQIWDVAQRDGMTAMYEAYTAQHPNVHIEVQVTSWREYWTKLEASAMSGKMPDIFWMHTNEILKYADNGKLADCSDIVETSNFSDVSLANASGSDGKLYAVPKDKDTVGLVLTHPEANPRPLHLWLRGLEPDTLYRVETLNIYGCHSAPQAGLDLAQQGVGAVFSGSTLMNTGYTLPQLAGDYPSVQLYLTRL